MRLDQRLTILVIFFSILAYRGLSQHVAEVKFEQARADELVAVEQISQAALPTPVSPSLDMPDFSASSLLIIDVDSASVLYEQNKDEIFLPASTTKLMTALVALDHFEPSDVLTVQLRNLEDGATVGLVNGEQLTVESLLTAMLVQSGNDAAEVLAINHPEGRSAFIRDMNAKAEELHLSKTIFENPTGFDGRFHQTTARDLSLLAQEVVKNELLAEIVQKRVVIVSDVTGKFKHPLGNTHALVGLVPGIKGVKTGTTDGAGQVLVTLVEREDHPVLIVMMNSQDRFAETRALIDWVYSAFEWRE